MASSHLKAVFATLDPHTTGWRSICSHRRPKCCLKEQVGTGFENGVGLYGLVRQAATLEEKFRFHRPYMPEDETRIQNLNINRVKPGTYTPNNHVQLLFQWEETESKTDVRAAIADN